MPAMFCIVLTVVVFAYVFLIKPDEDAGAEKTRLAYLQERKDVVYENLRDLNFEYKAGKYPEPDYLTMRAALEDEAVSILAEMAQLQPAR